jgi:hypothetical protein
LPFSAIFRHGPADWGIYDATSGAKLTEFLWDDDPDAEHHWAPTWNPIFDHLLLMKADKKGVDTLELFDVTQGKVIRQFPSRGGAWTADGTSVVLVRNNRIVFEPALPK